jgi:hypothetical protein
MEMLLAAASGLCKRVAEREAGWEIILGWDFWVLRLGKFIGEELRDSVQNRKD